MERAYEGRRSNAVPKEATKLMGSIKVRYLICIHFVANLGLRVRICFSHFGFGQRSAAQPANRTLPVPRSINARHIVPCAMNDADLPHNDSIMNPPEKPGKVIEFAQPQQHAVVRIEAFMGRLIESSDVMVAALVRLRDFYLAGAPPLAADKVLAQVAAALEMAERTRNGF